MNNFTLLQYDAQSNRTKLRDPNSTGEDCVYDARGRKTQCTDTQGDVTAYAYDVHSNLIKFTDAKTKDDTCVFDGRDRKTQCTDRNAGITKFVYDESSNLLSIEDADAVAGSTGKKTVYVYDPRNRKSSEAFPGHSGNVGDPTYDKVLFAYDGMNRLRTRTDQKNEVIGFAYDLASRLLTRSYPDTNNDTFTFDKASRLLTAATARYSNTVARSYNDDGTLSAESLTIDSQTYTVNYGYDDANRNTSLTYPSGKVVTRAYTDRNQLSNVEYDAADVIDRVYDDGMRLTSTTYGNGKVEARTYRNDNLTNTLGITGVTGFTYDYDANKNKKQEADSVLTNYSWTTGSSGYDDIDRLVGWSRTLGDTQSWSLSKVGDWNSTTVNGGTPETSTHDGVHQLTARGSTPLTYDEKGNLTGNSNGQLYAWDFDNKLKAADTDADTFDDATYAYDALGRRVSKTIITGAATTMPSNLTTVYVSARNREITEYPAGTAANAPIYEYVFGGYIDEVLLRVTYATSTKHYYHQDSLFSVRAITNAAGTVVERYAYDPYGKPIILNPAGTTILASSTIDNNILFTGRRLDPETGLQYSRARYYDFGLGRWIGRDILQYFDSWSLYNSVVANPHRYLDWNGYEAREPEASKSIKFQIGFDSSAKADEDTMNEMRKAVDNVAAALAKCCEKYKIGCDIKIERSFDFNNKDKPAPEDGDYNISDPNDEKLAKDNLKEINEGEEGVPVLVTGSTIHQDWQGRRIEAGATTFPTHGIVFAPGATHNTLPHETGHEGGYDKGDKDGGHHSTDPKNIMHTPAGTEPDKCWCEKVAGLAK